MGDSNIDQPGPSGVKRPRRQFIKPPKRLGEDDITKLLYESESDSEQSVELDQEGNDSSDSSDDEVNLYPGDEIVETENQLRESTSTWQEVCGLMSDIPFIKQNRLLIEPMETNEPYDFFRLLFDDNFLNEIVTESNRYAEEIFLSNTATPTARSRISDWRPLTVAELLRFLGLTFHMGDIKLNRTQDYWKKHRLFNLTCFFKFMSRDRYSLILRCLHFSKNPERGQPLPEDRLFKIRPILNYFNNRMDHVYYPGKNLSLDESMVLWKGRLVFRQYIKNKRHKYGIKLYMLAEPDGLVLRVIVYTGQLDVIGGKGHAQKVVLELLRGKLAQGHAIYMDNFYNSFELAKTLLDQKTFCTGTLRADRKGAPKDVVGAKLNKGQNKAKYLDGVVIGKWKDKREVTYISTEFKGDMMITRNKRGQEKEKPLPIIKYNQFMSGVDRQDQLMSYYPAQRKTLRWYKKLGIHVFHLLLHNSHILFNKYSGKKLTLREFRLAVIEKLLPEEEEERRERTKCSEHLPSKITNVNAMGKTLRKKCRVCAQKKKRKDTIYQCSVCPNQPGLCIDKCFTEYHKK